MWAAGDLARIVAAELAERAGGRDGAGVAWADADLDEHVGMILAGMLAEPRRVAAPRVLAVVPPAVAAALADLDLDV